MKLGRFTVAGYAIGLLVGLGIVVGYGAMEVSSTPAFCGTCHVMVPFYESWLTSSHANIACVDCHIPPGITAEFRKKYEALSMVARYFTGTYGTRPWAEIEDTSCLECHERRLLVGQELFGDVLFDHGPHLAELRRGKRLRCTSCHSQIVQGSHISVTQTTCTLCHFKGTVPGEGPAECTLCHQVPDHIVEAGGLRFDHGDVSRFGMACESCHPPPNPRAGRVPRERCQTCHSDPERLQKYDAGEFLHRTHVTDHKVECTDCHLEIEHVVPRHLEAAQTECATCHLGGHSPQRELYAGLGGKDVEPMPDAMYRAGVRCEGCHLNPDHGDTRSAGEVSCMGCHGPSYRRVYQSWKGTIQRRSKGVRRQLDQTARHGGASSSPQFADARSNLELVEKGKGIHNFRFSLALLEASHRQLNALRRENGLGALRTPWPSAPYESACLECHAGAEEVKTAIFGRVFRHETHVVTGKIECNQCHATHEERESSNIPALRIDASDCHSCHHAQVSADNCASCHAAVMEQSFAVELGEFDHSTHVEVMELACTECHGEVPDLHRVPVGDTCLACH